MPDSDNSQSSMCIFTFLYIKICQFIKQIYLIPQSCKFLPIHQFNSYIQSISLNQYILITLQQQTKPQSKQQIAWIQMHYSSRTIFQIMLQARAQQHADTQFLASTIGCIIDITQPLYRQKDNNYIIEVKLIDQTFNPLTDTEFLIKYLSVYLISSNSSDLRLTSRIGDFLYLQKFMFSTWNNVKLRGKFYGSFECVYEVNAGQLEDDEGWKMERRLGKESIPANIQELTLRISQMKNWLRMHFTQVFKPFIGVKIVNNYCAFIEPFSMILKANKIRKNEFEHFIFLQDLNKNHFYLDLKPFVYLLVKEDEWVYLRGVRQINVDRQIFFSQTGRIVGLPYLFAEEYEAQANYKAIYRKTNKLAQKKQSSSLTHVTFFDSKISTVKELFQLQDQYQSTSRKDEIMLQSHYLIKGALVKYSGNLKLYHTDYQMIVHDEYLEEIPVQEKKSTVQDRKLIYVYQGHIHIVDYSILYKKQCLKLMVFTDDPKSTFFDQKLLQELSKNIAFSNIQKKKQQTLKVIHEKLQKLKQLSTFEYPATLVLEPIRSDKLIFRLVNTKIL